MRGSSRRQRPRNKVRTKFFPLKGGLNLIDAPITIPDGMLLAALNYEPLSRSGYRRLQGFERYDGQASPSDASYWIIDFDAGTAAISEGDIVDGGTSGASGKALIDAVVESGSYVGTDAEGYLVLTNVTGIFQDNEDLEVSAVKKSDSASVAVERNAPTPALDSTYAQDAIETQRATILAVGSSDGSGPVRGANVYQGDRYAFRNNAAATACLMWKATSSGWVQQNLGIQVEFDTGTVIMVEGNTLTQGGVTATIDRLVVQSGTWGGGDAAGLMIISSVSGGNFISGAATDGVLGAVNLTGAESNIAIPPGGHYEFRNDNFFGTSSTKRMYGVNGVGTAFEWDGTVFVPIKTGNTNDTPTHIEINEYHLMLAFERGSLQNSATGNPYLWSGGGAAEIGCGDDIVALQKEVGGAMAVICRDRTHNLQGKNTTELPWDLQSISKESGGIEWTCQRIGYSRYLDDRGFTRLEAVDVYGDFKDSTYSQLIEPLVNEKKTEAIESIIVKGKNQLRTFFEDGTGIISTFNDKKLAGFSTLTYKNSSGSTVPVRCTANGEDSSGKEIMFFGSDDGYLYQMDKGTSFDGGAVDASLILTYSHQGYPANDKEYKKVTMEADGSSGTVIEYNVLLDYSSGRSPAGITLQETLAAGGAYWNEAIWNQFNWASEDVTQIEGNIDGVGRNISLQISSSGTYVEPHTLYGVTYHYILRKLVR